MVQLINSVKGIKVVVDGLEYNYQNDWGNYYTLEGTSKLTKEEVCKLISEEEWDENEVYYKELGLDVVSGYCEYYEVHNVKKDFKNRTYIVTKSLWNNDLMEGEGFELAMEQEIMILPMDGTVYVVK